MFWTDNETRLEKFQLIHSTFCSGMDVTSCNQSSWKPNDDVRIYSVPVTRHDNHSVSFMVQITKDIAEHSSNSCFAVYSYVPILATCRREKIANYLSVDKIQTELI